MSRLFTEAHRAQFIRGKREPNYHGDAAEAIYIEAMQVLDELNHLTMILKYRTQAFARLAHRKTWRNQADRNMSDPRDKRAICKRIAETQGRLSALRRHYRFHHQALHNPEGLLREVFSKWP